MVASVRPASEVRSSPRARARDVEGTWLIVVALPLSHHTSSGIGGAIDLLDHLENREVAEGDKGFVAAGRSGNRSDPPRPDERAHHLWNETGGGAEFVGKSGAL